MTTTFPEPLWALPTWAMEATGDMRFVDIPGPYFVRRCYCLPGPDDRLVRFQDERDRNGDRLTVVLDGPMLGETP
jgi:hypothetical protein